MMRMWLLEGPRDVVFLRLVTLGTVLGGLILLGVTLAF